MNPRYVTALIVVVIMLAGCTSRSIYNVDNEPISAAPGRHLTLSETGEAITEALEGRRWNARRVSDNHIVGSHTFKYLVAVVDIRFSPTHYSITHKYSKNLGYRGGDKIHKRYNKWVKRLHISIKASLATR